MGKLASYCVNRMIARLSEIVSCTAKCSEIGSLTSLDVAQVHSSDVREPISLHHSV